jgi:hypothetical protein
MAHGAPAHNNTMAVPLGKYNTVYVYDNDNNDI